MLSLDISADIARVTRIIGGAGKQFPFAAMSALNALAFTVQARERDNIATTFKHPRPFTVRSVMVDKATKSNLASVVRVRPEVARYVLPYETGGLHWLPGKGLTLLEPRLVTLDQYGQMRLGTTARLKVRQSVFVGVVKTGSGPVSGFWQRVKAQHGQPRLKLLIKFGDNRDVVPNLAFERRAESVVYSRAAQMFAESVARAMATAR